MGIGDRILEFFNFCFINNLEHGICYFENEYHVTVSRDGKIYSYGQQKTLTAAMDECGQGLAKGGF